jgi:hypothetical protein
MQRIFWLGFFACAVIGAIVGNLVWRSKNPVLTATSIGTSGASMLVIFVAMGSAIALGTDLRKPLWWMGPDALRMRLFAWVVGTSWRLGVCLCVGLIACSIAVHSATVAFAGVPLAIATVLYLRAVGLTLYAMFPSSVDQRGPMAMLRALLTYLFAAPPVIVGSIAGGLSHSIGVAVAAGILTSAIETFGLVSFAASRIAGRGVAVAQAEAM